MKADKLRRSGRRRADIILLILAVLVCIGLLGVSFARYRTKQKHMESAQLTDFQIKVTDLFTWEAPDWVIELPATTRLYDDQNFDETVIVKRLMIQNEGSQTVDLKAELLEDVTEDYHGSVSSEQESEDILLYIAGSDVSSGFQDVIQKAAEDAGEMLNAESTVVRLKSSFTEMNKNTLKDWSYTMAPGDIKYMTVMIWRENPAVNEVDTFGGVYYLDHHLKLAVKQE